MSSYANRLWQALPSADALAEAAGSAVGQATDLARDAAGQAMDYGNSAVQQAMDAGQGALDGVTGVAHGALDGAAELAKGAVEGGNQVLDAAAEQIGLDWTQDPGVVGTETGELPEQVVAAPVQVEEPPQTSTDPDVYKDQVDNKSPYVPGHSSCSPTSFTMALLSLHGGDEAAVRARTVELLDNIGARTDYEQLEELIIELLQKTDWAAAYKNHRSFFWGNWIHDDPNVKKGTVYKDPYAQQYIASLYDGVDATGTEAKSGVKGADGWAPIVQALDEGAAVTSEGAFTDAGHVVQVLSGDSSGLVINDPYGCWVKDGVYIRNGAEQVPGLGSQDEATLVRRAGQNSAILDAYESFADPNTAKVGFARWGEKNVYTYADADAVGLGKWVSVIRKA